MQITSTQRVYLGVLSQQPGPVPAADAFSKFRMSKLSIGRLIEAGAVEREMIDGRSHYRLTAKGIAALAQQ